LTKTAKCKTAVNSPTQSAISAALYPQPLQSIDFTGIFTDFKSVSNSEFFKGFVKPFLLLKSGRGREAKMRKNYFPKFVFYMKNKE